MMGLYNILKVYYAIEQTMESCVPLGVTDFVRTSSQEIVGGVICTFFFFSRVEIMAFNEKEKIMNSNYILVLAGSFLCTFSLVSALLSRSILTAIMTVLSMIAGFAITAFILSRQ